MSQSQLGQDLYVLSFYQHKRNGYFIEIGANDGITLSNTYLLEKEYGWTGICAEPIPTSYNKLVTNRPGSHCCDKPVYRVTGEQVTFSIANTCDLYSGIDQYIGMHKKRVESNKTTITLETISLNDLLRQYHAPPHIEYLSLDTEGSEYEILRTFDFGTYTFGLIDVEHNYEEPRRTHIRDLLLSNGYEFVEENKWDDRYQLKSTTNKNMATT